MVHTERMGGSRFLNAMRIGMLLPNFNPSDRMLDVADACLETCPTIDKQADAVTPPVRQPVKNKAYRPIIWRGVRAEIQLGPDCIDISSAYSFKGRAGHVVPTKDNDVVASKLIRSMQDDGFFSKKLEGVS